MWVYRWLRKTNHYWIGRVGPWISRSACTSPARYRRWPPRVLMQVNLPALAQRVTVLGSTLKSAATSAGVSNCSISGLRPDTSTSRTGLLG